MLSSVSFSLRSVTESFSPSKAKKKVFISLKPQKPKHRQYPSSSSESCHCFVWMNWKHKCMCAQVCMCGQVGVHAQYVHTRLRAVISFCKCYASTKKKSEAFWLLLFPGRVILFFQIRALTGFWFCILKWFKSGLTFLVLVVCVGVLHPDGKDWITDQAS